MKKLIAFLAVGALLWGMTACSKRYTCPTYIKNTQTIQTNVQA